MTAMLASIASVAEAAVLLESGVDIVDIKEPSHGALGAVTHDTAVDIVHLVGQRAKTSATIGDLPVDSDQLLERIRKTASTGVDYVKVGLFSDRPSISFMQQIAQATAERINVVVVAFAEHHTSWAQLQPLTTINIAGLMLDTCNKNGKPLPALLGNAALAFFIKQAKQANLLTGLAGSLRLTDINSLLKLAPDYLGFRGALCDNHNRIQPINKQKALQIRKQIVTNRNTLFNTA